MSELTTEERSALSTANMLLQRAAAQHGADSWFMKRRANVTRAFNRDLPLFEIDYFDPSGKSVAHREGNTLAELLA